jgi:energy-coupling factor transport system ATP-binding protein
MPEIRCEGVGFTYPGGVHALDGVDLVIGQGERIAIVGQNGSGKSTLVRHFNGLLRPATGRVTVGELDTRPTRIARLAREVALAFQDPDRQIFSGSVEAEVSFGARNVGMKGAELESSLVGALQSVGLGKERRTNPYDLGYSRRKLLTIASVLAMQTPIVVLDEPTTGQDARGVRTIQVIVDRLASDGRTVVAISHDMRFVAESLDRVVVMRGGRIILDGPVAEAFSKARWIILRSTNLEPTYPAALGSQMGFGSTPTDQAFVEALIAQSGATT